jgi:hypothetical protein
VCHGLQEHDLKLALGEDGQERDLTVYLGLAATAFLLVMLHPSNKEGSSPAPSALHPVTQEGLQVCSVSDASS